MEKLESEIIHGRMISRIPAVVLIILACLLSSVLNGRCSSETAIRQTILGLP